MVVVRVPPHNSEAEQAVLGSLLIDKEAISEVSEIITPEYFYEDTNRDIYQAMLELFEQRKPIDILTLTTILKNKKLYQKVGGASYITSLANVVPTAANVMHYAQILRERYIRRSMISLGAELTDLGFDEEMEANEIINRAEQGIFRLSSAQIKTGFIHIKEALAESFDRMEEMHKNGESVLGVETGFADIDTLLAGLHDSNLIILAARPGQGKTAFTLNIAQYVASVNKHAVGIFSLEMSKEELVDRLLVAQADIDAWKLKTKKLSDDDGERLAQAMGELADAPLFIDDTPGISLPEIRTKARRLQIEHGLKLLVIDYLQLVDPGKKFENRVQEVTHISKNLKNLARELKIPIIAASQLSRAVENRGDKKPQLSDLRESGSIEQDADVVMFLYSPEEEFMPQRIVSVLVAKHRNGPVGEKELLFRGDRIRFYNIEKRGAELSSGN